MVTSKQNQVGQISRTDVVFLLNYELRKVHFFKDASAEFISALAEYMEPRIYQVDQEIISFFLVCVCATSFS